MIKPDHADSILANDQFVIYQGDNARYALVPQREALAGIKDQLGLEDIQRELQYLNENKVDKENLVVFDENISTWTGQTQEEENKAFVSSVYDYNDLGDVVAENGRLVLVKKPLISGIFECFIDSGKVADGGSVIEDSQGRMWERKDTSNPRLDWWEGDFAEGMQKCLDKFGTCRLGNREYVFNKAVRIKTGDSIFGFGRGSVIRPNFATSLFTVTEAVGSMTFSDFWVRPLVSRNQNSFIFDCKLGVYRCNFSNLWIGNENYDYDSGADYTGGFFTSGEQMVCDTITFHNIWTHRLTGIGYQIGRGSSVWLIGGRTIGLGAVASVSGSIGIQLCGGFGGFWNIGNDVIGLDIGMAQGMGNGHGSNREVFLVSACFDSCKRAGYVIEDNGCRIHATNLWSASAGNANVAINYSENNNTLLEINGGDIFNSNAYGTKTGDSSYGLVINGGNVKINNVTFEANGQNTDESRNIFCANKATRLSITGCTFRNTFGNKEDVIRASEALIYSDNISERIPMVHAIVDIGSVRAMLNAFKFKDSTPYEYTPVMPVSDVEIIYAASPFDCEVYINSGFDKVKVFLDGNEYIDAISPVFRVSVGDRIKLQYIGLAPTWAFRPIF